MTDQGGEPRIVNADDLDPTGTDEDGGRWTRLGREAGSVHLGCTLEEIPPGGSPARYHYHVANEEAMFVLEGEGSLRTRSGKTGIESGDYVSFPVGEAGAHAVENTSDELLRCLFFSTMHEPDVVVYPDEEELFVVAGAALGQSREKFTLEATFPFDADSVDDVD